MIDKTDITNIFKSQLGSADAPFSETLWSKLDTELIPIRAAYQKERKRRIFAYWSTAAILLIGGAGLLVYSNSGETKKANPIVQNNIPQKSCCTKPTLADRFDINTNPLTTTTSDSNDNSITSNKDSDTSPNGNNEKHLQKNKVTSVIENNTSAENTTPIHKVAKKKNKTTITAVNGNKLPSIEIADNTTLAESSSSRETNIGEEKASTTIAPTEEKAIAKTTEKINIIDVTKNAIITDAKAVATKLSSQKPIVKVQAVGGVNLSSSFDKPSYYGGAQLQLSVNQKLIFARIKVSKNDLNHQLLSIDKAGTTPTMADAVIQKMTTIQLPFGYQFLLNKKQKNSTLLNVGFEPTLLTGIHTIYYDNNGVLGGPTIAVVNSPLIDKAINKFNLSFIAGVQRRIGRRSHLFGNVGYSLINITDKQFYNKVGGSNNLKYAQFGVGFDLIK